MPSIHFPTLYNACMDGDAAAVSRALPATRLNLSGPRFQAPGGKSTPLMAAAQKGSAETVRIILKRAPNTAVDYVDATGDTALLVAARYHHADILGLLAVRSGNVDYVPARGHPAARRHLAFPPRRHDAPRPRPRRREGGRHRTGAASARRRYAPPPPLAPASSPPRNPVLYTTSTLKIG